MTKESGVYRSTTSPFRLNGVNVISIPSATVEMHQVDQVQEDFRSILQDVDVVKIAQEVSIHQPLITEIYKNHRHQKWSFIGVGHPKQGRVDVAMITSPLVTYDETIFALMAIKYGVQMAVRNLVAICPKEYTREDQLDPTFVYWVYAT